MAKIKRWICKKTKQSNDVKSGEDNSFAYLDLLSDNSPQAYPEYNVEAEILHKQISNPSVLNIAVVAKYGAGKSSVINTYLSRHRNKKTRKEKKQKEQSQLGKSENNRYTRVTLATFIKTDYDETAVERSILQQLLYSRKKNELPNSKIERTNKTSKWWLLLLALLIAIFFSATSLFGLEVGGINLFGLCWIKYLFLGIAFVSLIILVLVFLNHHKISRIKYKDLEADFQNDKPNSPHITNLINKFADEVLYFFECVDIDLVIFEDLDRLPTTEIFAKLRELNTIINASKKRENIVTFLYAVKDDLFKTDEERAKFFEFILPVIPVINPVTTKAKIEKRLKELTTRNPLMDLSSKFIKGISVYIPDMRILNNSFNDYIMMFHKIFEDENANKRLNSNKLFALCLYKNLFPYDYALLEKNSGLIPQIINLPVLREKCARETKDELAKLTERLKKLQEERTASFEELKLLFIGQLTQLEVDMRFRYTINPDTITTFKDINLSAIIHPAYRNQGYGVKLPSGQTELLTPNKERYIDKENAIIEREKNGIELTKNRIAELEKQKLIILTWTFAEIVEQKGVDFCYSKESKNDYIERLSEGFSGEQINLQFAFLRFLISQDYIDEHYIEYTSNYNSEILSLNDTKLVQAIQGREQNFAAVVDNLNGVIRWLDDDDFKHTAILSKNLLLNIIKVKEFSEGERDSKFNNLVNLLNDTVNPEVIETIREFINTAEQNDCPALLKIVIPGRPTLCNEILEADKLEASKKDFVVAEVIKYSPDYEAVNNTVVRNYIGKHVDYLALFGLVGDDKKAIKFIDECSIIFDKLSKEQLNSPLQQHIITMDKYKLTLENLETIFTVDSENIVSDFYTRNYDYILTSDKESLINYINQNIDTYAKVVLMNDKVTCSNEPEERIADLIKNTQIELTTRKAIIEKSSPIFKNIKDFESDLYVILFDNYAIESTWLNVQIAFEKLGFDCVKNHLKTARTITGAFVGLEGIKEETPIALITNILRDLTPDEITTISATLPPEIAAITELNAADIDDENLSEFVSSGKIKYSDIDFGPLYKKPKTLREYLKKHESNIMNNFDNFFLKALPISTTQQVSEHGMIINKTIYSPRPNAQSMIAAVIECKGISVSMKQTLIEKCFRIIKIEEYERSYANYIINEKQPVPSKILWQFTAVTSISESDKKTILIQCIDQIDPTTELAQYRDYFKTLGDDWFKVYETTEELRVEQTSENENLLTKLKDKKLLTYRRSNKKFTKVFIVKAL